MKDVIGGAWDDIRPHVEETLLMENLDFGIEHVTDDCQCEGKQCTKCKEVKCVNAFGRSSRSSDGRRNPCKVCRKANYNPEPARRYRETHKEHLHELNRKWREDHAEYDRQRRRTYRQANLERERERQKLQKREHRKTEQYQFVMKNYTQRNAERLRQNGQEYYWKNRENRLAYNRQWREDHAEYDRIRKELYRIQHPEKSAMQHKNWIASHPGYRVARNRRRRACKRNAPGTFTAEQIKEQLKRQHYRCYYLRCGQCKFPKDEKRLYGYRFHIEHVIPLSRSEHEPRNDMSNIVLSCESCNASKRDKLPHEWPEGGHLF